MAYAETEYRGQDPFSGGETKATVVEAGGVPIGVSADAQGGILPGMSYAQGSADAGGFHFQGEAGAKEHLNLGYAPNADGVMTAGLDFDAKTMSGSVSRGPLTATADGPNVGVHASMNGNQLHDGASATIAETDLTYDDGTRKAMIGAGAGVGADATLHYDKDPKDGKRSFGLEGDVDFGPGVKLGYQTKKPAEDLETAGGWLPAALDWGMGKAGLADYSPGALAASADDWLQKKLA